MLGKPKPAPNNQVRFCSPFIPKGKKRDSKHHLYVNVDKGVYFCFRTTSSGSLSYLFTTLGLPFTDEPDLPLTPLAELKKRVYSLTSEETFVKPRAGLPEEYRPLRRGSMAHRYLLSRGLTEDDIEFYRIGEGCDNYHGWVIIPSFDVYGRCEYWVARNTDPDAWGSKYDNPHAARKYHVSFLNQALSSSEDKSIILCEGVFSAIIAGRTAVASFGKFVSNTQFTAMEIAGVKTLRVCLDGDAWKETLDVAKRALGRGMAVTIIPLPLKEDPADMGRAVFFDHLAKHEFPVTETSLMKLRLESVL